MDGKLVYRLKSGDFFMVEKHPKARFKIIIAAPIARAKAGENNDTITGNLVIKGSIQHITFPGQGTINSNKADDKATIDIGRTKYDIKFRSGSSVKNLSDKMIYDIPMLDLNLISSEQI